MTTKPPSKVKEFTSESLEKIAYNSVKNVATVEPNDAHRLGYHVFLMLKNKNGTLESAVSQAEARLQVSKKEAVKIIREALISQGIDVD